MRVNGAPVVSLVLIPDGDRVIVHVRGVKARHGVVLRSGSINRDDVAGGVLRLLEGDQNTG